MPKEQHVRTNRWRSYERTFSDSSHETRFIREIIYGQRHTKRYWQLTTDKETLPSASTWMVMTHIEDISYKQVGDLYGLRNWVEYGFKQCKNELGWADFRVTDYAVIEKWWEIVMSAYLMVALHTPPMRAEGVVTLELDTSPIVRAMTQHCEWQIEQGWKNRLNNLRLILLPWVCANRLRPWLSVFPIAELEQGFEHFVARMNQFRGTPPIISSA